MKFLYCILLAILLFNPGQASAKCPNRIYNYLAEFKLLSAKLLPDRSVQIIWKNNQKVISLLQFYFPSNSNFQLKILANSVSKQLAEVAQNRKIKTINNDANFKIHKRLFRLVFTSSIKIPHSLEIAGIFSDSNCTEIIRYTDINPSSDTESLNLAINLMKLILD